MFEDVTLNKIDKDLDQPSAKGGFGAVYKIKHPFVSNIFVNVKYIYV